MELLQQMLQSGSLAEFIDELGQIMWQEKANEQRWDFWLHRVDSMSFEEYVQLCEDSMRQPEGSGNLEATVKYSYEMMENFHPEKKGEINGTVQTTWNNCNRQSESNKCFK